MSASQKCVNVKHFYYKALHERGGGGVVVKVLRYKPAGRWFDSQWCHWNFSQFFRPWGRLNL